MSTTARIVFVCTGLALAACSSSQPPVTQVPPAGQVLTFTASPASLPGPGEVTLSWTTKDATHVSLTQLDKGSITIDGTQADGSVTLRLEQSTSFLLSARGEGGTTSRPLAVTVGGESVNGIIFEVTPKEVLPGETVTLTWYAPGATSISLREVGLGELPTNGQIVSGTLTRQPTKTTTYRLEVDSTKSVTAEVVVKPVIELFALDGPAPAPGEMVTLAWKTSGASMLTIEKGGSATPLLSESDPVKVAQGQLTDTVSAALPPSGVLTYRLTLGTGAAAVVRGLEIRLAGGLRITALTTPTYVRPNVDAPVTWATSGAQRVELLQDGQSIYIAGTQAQANAGSTSVRTPPSGTTQVQLRANGVGGSFASRMATIEVVGLPTVQSFTASATSLAEGGAPVTLSWQVNEARHVRITDLSTNVVVHDRVGAQAVAGSVVVFPNRAQVGYRLEGDNGAGDTITPRVITVNVAQIGTLTYERRLATGATVNVTGHSVDGGTELTGLPNVIRNAPGAAFIDIRDSGTEIEFVSADTTPEVVTIPGFTTTLFGTTFATTSASISPNGHMRLDGPASTSTIPTGPLGSNLEPLTLAPYTEDLFLGPDAHVHWQMDTVANEQRLIVQWTDVEGYVDDTARLTFQAQVHSNGKVVFAYQKLLNPIATPAIGVVNFTETQVVIPQTVPVAGDTFTYFGPPASFPVPMVIEAAPYFARVKVPQGSVEVTGNPRADLQITEINPRPADAGVVNGEWIEVLNRGATAEDLMGWTFELGTTSTFTVPSTLPVPAGGRIVVAQDTLLGDPSIGITAAATYPTTFAMSDTSGTLKLRYGTAGLASQVTWDSAMVPASGVAVRFDPNDPSLVYNSSTSQLGCSAPASAPTYGTSAQRGTPGAANGTPCFGFQLERADAGSFVSIADAGTALLLGTAASVNDVLLPLTLPAPVTLFGASTSTLSVSTNGFVAATAPTSSLPTNRTVPSTPFTVAPFWDDLTGTAATGAGIYWQQLDPDATPASGDEVTIVSWEGWRPSATTTASLNFQVKLFASGALEYHYGALSGSTQTHLGSSATVWLEHPTGRAALPAQINSATLAPNSVIRYVPLP